MTFLLILFVVWRFSRMKIRINPPVYAEEEQPKMYMRPANDNNLRVVR